MKPCEKLTRTLRNCFAKSFLPTYFRLRIIFLIQPDDLLGKTHLVIFAYDFFV